MTYSPENHWKIILMNAYHFFFSLYWKNGIIIALLSSFYANAEILFPSLGHCLWHSAVNTGSKGRTHSYKVLKLGCDSRKVAKSASKRSVSSWRKDALPVFVREGISGDYIKNWQRDRGVSAWLPPPGGAIAATKSMSLTCTTPVSSLHQNQKWLNSFFFFLFFFMSLPTPKPNEFACSPSASSL